jgi:hypothetical protein
MKGGTKMEYGGVRYHFTPNDLGDYVAEVSNPQHYDAILSIGAGYRPYPNSSAEEAAASVQARIDADTVMRQAAATRVQASGGGGGTSPDAGKTIEFKNPAPAPADKMAAVRAAKAAKKAAQAA